MLAKRKDLSVRDGIVGGDALFAAAHQSGIRQALEVAGDAGLSGMSRIDKFGDALFTLFQGDEQFEAGRLAQDLKPGGDEADGIIREVFGFSGFGIAALNLRRA